MSLQSCSKNGVFTVRPMASKSGVAEQRRCGVDDPFMSEFSFRVAEGAQSPLELRAAREAGCTDAQGCLLMRPMSMQAMRQWLRGLEGLRLPPEEELAGDVFLKRR